MPRSESNEMTFASLKSIKNKSNENESRKRNEINSTKTQSNHVASMKIKQSPMIETNQIKRN